MSEVDDPWTMDADIRDFTDVDLDESRTKYTRVGDAGGQLRMLAAALGDELGLTLHEVLDRAVRVEVAAAIDDSEVYFDRDEYGVGLLIPPRGWVHQQTFGLPYDLDAVDVDTSGRGVGFSIPPTVYEMTQAAIDDGAYESLTVMVREGLNRLAVE